MLKFMCETCDIVIEDVDVYNKHFHANHDMRTTGFFIIKEKGEKLI